LYNHIVYFLLVCGIAFGVAHNSDAIETRIVRADSVRVDTIIEDSIIADTLVSDTISADSSKSSAITSPVEYQSNDSIRFVIADRKVFVYGESNVLYQDIDLKAEVIELDMANREVLAYGKLDTVKKTNLGEPHFKQGTEEFDAEKLLYNFESERGLVYGIVTEQSDGFLHSKVTKIQENKEVHVRGGKYTTCDLEHPHFYVHMTKAKMIPEDKIVTGPAFLVIEDVPVPLAIPFGFFPNKKGRQSGILMPTLGEETSQGFFMKNGGIYLGFNDYVDFAFRGDIYSLGSWRTNGKTNYAKRYKYKGTLQAELASLVIYEEPQNKTYKVNWVHTQDAKAHPTRRFSANVNYMSAAHNRQNARNYDQLYNNQIQSSVLYSNRTADNMFNYSASFSHNQNLLDSTISLTLPGAHVSMTNVYPFKRKNKVGRENFIDRFSVGYSADVQHSLANGKLDSTFYTKETLDEFRKGIKHTVPVSTSMKMLKFFTLSPSAQYSERWYFDRARKEYVLDDVDSPDLDPLEKNGKLETYKEYGFYRVYDYSTSLALSTKIYGMYNYKMDLIRAMRHMVTPRVSYSYSPDFSTDAYGYYSTYEDKDEELVRYSLYENSVYGVPGQGESSVISYSLGNNLEMKVRNRKDTVTGTKKISLIETFNISGRYDLLADSMPLSDITINASNKFLKNRLTVKYSATLDPYAMGKDSMGVVRPVNRYMIDEYGRLWRKEQSQWSFLLSLNLGPVKKETNSKDDVPKSSLRYPGYEDFSVPWSMSVNYNLTMPKTYKYDENSNLIETDDGRVMQTFGVNGNFSVTKKWKVTYSSGLDLSSKDVGITRTHFGIYRDLHCWEMNFSWYPIGQMQRYEFKINVKASVFQDLKYEKSSDEYKKGVPY